MGEGERGKRNKPLSYKEENLSPWHELLMRSLRLQGNRKGTGTNSARRIGAMVHCLGAINETNKVDPRVA